MATEAKEPTNDVAEKTFEHHRGYLEEHIDPDTGLLDKLRDNRTLSKREFIQIKHCKTFIDRNSELLNFILAKHQCDRLVTALRETDQIHIVNYLKENGDYKTEIGLDWPLTEKKASILNTNHESLVDLLECGELLGLLYSSKVINKRQMESISSKPTSHEKNEALLECLERRSSRDYLQAIKCLHQTKQSHIAEILEKGGAVVRVHVELGGVDVDRTEDEIIEKFKAVLLSKPAEERTRIIEGIQIIAAEKGHSVVLYFYCKTLTDLVDLREMQTSGKLKVVIERLFNRILSPAQYSEVTVDNLKSVVESLFTQLQHRSQIANLTMTLSENEYKKCRSIFPDLAAEDQRLKTAINKLPLELLDVILQKAYLHYSLSGKKATEKGDEFLLNRLFSVDFCWFQRLNKRRFKKTIWRHLSKFYEEFRKRIVISRTNRLYLEENIQPVSLFSRLRTDDCLTDVETRLLSRQMLVTKKMFRRNNNPDLLHMIRSFDDAKHSDFIICLCQSNQKLIARMAENGVSLKATILIRVSPKRLDQRLNDFRDKTKRRSHQMDKLISQLKDDGIEILNYLPDRQNVVWIWCQSQTGLEKIQKLNESSSLLDVFIGLLFPSSSPEINKTMSVSICREQFKKNCVVFLFIVNFTKRLKIKEYERVRGVTKLRKEIYVLCNLYVIRVFEDRNPFRLQRVIEIKEIKSPRDIASSEKENCLYVADPDKNCIWKITRETDDKHKIIKWLTIDKYGPNTLSMSSDGQLLVVSWYSSILSIYGSDAELLRSVELTRDIKQPIHAVETSIGNFIVLHRLLEKEEEWKDGPRESGIWEVTKDGQMVIRCFIPSDETQKLKDPYYLSLDSDDKVFVADCGNKRMILLDSDLKWNRILCPKRKGHEQNVPYRLCYDEEKKQLIVGFFRKEVDIYTLNRK